MKIVSVSEPKNKDIYLNLTYLRGAKEIVYYILSLASKKKIGSTDMNSLKNILLKMEIQNFKMEKNP